MKCTIRKGGNYCPRTKKKCTNAMETCAAQLSPVIKAHRKAVAEAHMRHVADKSLNIAKRIMRPSLFNKQSKAEVVGIADSLATMSDEVEG